MFESPDGNFYSRGNVLRILDEIYEEHERSDGEMKKGTKNLGSLCNESRLEVWDQSLVS